MKKIIKKHISPHPQGLPLFIVALVSVKWYILAYERHYAERTCGQHFCLAAVLGR